MTAFQLIGPMPALELDSGCTVTVEAINPDSGAAVTGVTVSNVVIYGNNFVPGEDLNAAPPDSEVLYAYQPSE